MIWLFHCACVQPKWSSPALLGTLLWWICSVTGLRAKRQEGQEESSFQVKCAFDMFSKDIAQDSPPTQVRALITRLRGYASLPPTNKSWLPAAEVSGRAAPEQPTPWLFYIKAESPNHKSAGAQALEEERTCFSLTVRMLFWKIYLRLCLPYRLLPAKLF